MRYLTPQQVLFIHARLIDETGGSHGVRDTGLLESAVARPRATFIGQELYPDLYTKAAALFDSLVRNHSFVDGNKRTALTATALFLRLNGCRFTAHEEAAVAFTLSVARSELDLAQIAAWLKTNSLPEP